MTAVESWTAILTLFGSALVLGGWGYVQVKQRRRWHEVNEAEDRAAKASLTPAE